MLYCRALRKRSIVVCVAQLLIKSTESTRGHTYARKIAKKVSATELFYDLVFAYAVSQITEIFEPLRHHAVTWITVLLYITVFISFIGSWNIQNIYFNRFGEHNLKDIISMTVLQMRLLLLWDITQPLNLSKTLSSFPLN